MSRDPAFLFYSSDFLIGTFGMSDAQVGQYIRLMCLQHQKGHLSEQLIKSITGGALDSGVMAKFDQDEEGLYYNVRLEEESKKRAKYAESRRQNRLKHNTSSSYDKHMSNICKTHDLHMENENEDININTKSPKKGVVGGNKTSLENRFNDLWALYPRKQGRADALKAYEKAVKSGVTDEVIKRGIENYVKHIAANKTDPQYIKQGSTFFSKQAWADDYKVITAQPIEYKEELPY